MRERDYYPAGAYSDGNAPYNEKELPEIEVSCEVSELMVKSGVTVNTNQYANDYDDYGHVCGRELLITRNDVKTLYEENHYTVQELLEELERRLKEDIKKPMLQADHTKIAAMLADCKGWTGESIEIEKYEA